MIKGIMITVFGGLLLLSLSIVASNPPSRAEFVELEGESNYMVERIEKFDKKLDLILEHMLDRRCYDPSQR